MFAILTVFPPRLPGPGILPVTAGAGPCPADPLHCYVVDQAHSAGVIDVEAMYEAGGVLYIYLTQTDPVGNGVGAFFKEQATEFVERWARPGVPG